MSMAPESHVLTSRSCSYSPRKKQRVFGPAMPHPPAALGTMALDEIKPEEIIFLERLGRSQHSHIFKVSIRHRVYVMKVHHGRGPAKYYEPKDRELDIHILEVTAYRRLKDHGVCDDRVVPDFYGAIRKFDPSLCRPYLDSFEEDGYLPSAIFLEYIPNLETIDIDKYTPERMSQFSNSIRRIHTALVLHNDVYPRNMGVLRDRVLWFDFDRAETLCANAITSKERDRLAHEGERVDEFGERFASDHAEGKLNKMLLFY